MPNTKLDFIKAQAQAVSQLKAAGFAAGPSANPQTVYVLDPAPLLLGSSESRVVVEPREIRVDSVPHYIKARS